MAEFFNALETFKALQVHSDALIGSFNRFIEQCEKALVGDGAMAFEGLTHMSIRRVEGLNQFIVTAAGEEVLFDFVPAVSRSMGVVGKVHVRRKWGEAVQHKFTWHFKQNGTSELIGEHDKQMNIRDINEGPLVMLYSVFRAMEVDSSVQL